jgi:hypothetical protein
MGWWMISRSGAMFGEGWIQGVNLTVQHNCPAHPVPIQMSWGLKTTMIASKKRNRDIHRD